jgi:hypothetical protein
MRQFTLSRFSHIEALPSTETSSLVSGARRFGLIQFSAPGTLQSRASAVTGDEGSLTAKGVIYMRRFTLSKFSSLGVPLIFSRTPLVAADRNAAIAGLGGYLAGRSYAVPDVTGGISVTFEEVYPI